MSSNNPNDSKREEFRRYLDCAGVTETLTNILGSLYQEPDRPEDALEYVRKHLGIGGDGELEAARALTAELEAAKALTAELEAARALTAELEASRALTAELEAARARIAELEAENVLIDLFLVIILLISVGNDLVQLFIILTQ